MTEEQESCPIDLDQRVYAEIDGEEVCLTCLSIFDLNYLLNKPDLDEGIKKDIRLALNIRTEKYKDMVKKAKIE